MLCHLCVTRPESPKGKAGLRRGSRPLVRLICFGCVHVVDWRNKEWVCAAKQPPIMTPWHSHLHCSTAICYTAAAAIILLFITTLQTQRCLICLCFCIWQACSFFPSKIEVFQLSPPSLRGGSSHFVLVNLAEQRMGSVWFINRPGKNGQNN